MRYSLALYCPDLKDSSKDFIPVGVLVVDEETQKYKFQGLSILPTPDFMTNVLWRGLPTLLEQRLLQYVKEPNHNSYKQHSDEYHGFISQVIQESEQSTVCFSDSILVEEKENIDKITKRLFQEKVLRRLD